MNFPFQADPGSSCIQGCASRTLVLVAALMYASEFTMKMTFQHFESRRWCSVSTNWEDTEHYVIGKCTMSSDYSDASACFVSFVRCFRCVPFAKGL